MVGSQELFGGEFYEKASQLHFLVSSLNGDRKPSTPFKAVQNGRDRFLAIRLRLTGQVLIAEIAAVPPLNFPETLIESARIGCIEDYFTREYTMIHDYEPIPRSS